MDFEAPVDAWYVWLGVAAVSVALAGVVLSLPSQPPPDAVEAANTIDRVAASTYTADASYEHDAAEVRIGVSRVSMRNDGGTDHASVAFGPLTPLAAAASIDGTERPDAAEEYAALEAVLHGEHPSAVVEEFDGVDDEAQLYDATAEARAAVETDDELLEWVPATGTLHVRRIELDGEVVVLVTA